MAKLVGRVIPGRGDGRFFMSMEGYQKQFEEKLHCRLFQGTFNLSCDPSLKKALIAALPPIEIRGFDNDGSFFGSAKVYCVTIKSMPCFIIVPAVNFHDESTLEIAAPFNLREKLGVKDGDELTVDA